MTRPLLFISHVHDDAVFATILHEELDQALLGGARFFDASDRASLRPGDPWRDRIMDALRESAVVLVVASPRSVPSPWVNFESGGGWLAGARVIPCCVGGMVPSSLPAPLGHLQALDLTTPQGVDDLFRSVADAAELRVPHNLDSSGIARRVSDAATGALPDAAEFVAWINRSALRPQALKDTSGVGEAFVGGHVATADAGAVSTFRGTVKKGESVRCWVEIPGLGGTLYYCYASGEQAEQIVGLSTGRFSASRYRARLTLRCLGVLKVFATDINLGDEDQGVSYEPAYLIEQIELVEPSD